MMLLPPGGGAGLIDATSNVGVTAGCADAMLDATAIRPATTIIGFMGQSQLLTRCLRKPFALIFGGRGKEVPKVALFLPVQAQAPYRHRSPILVICRVGDVLVVGRDCPFA